MPSTGRCRPPHCGTMTTWRGKWTPTTSLCHRCRRGGVAPLLRVHQRCHLPRRGRGKLGPNVLIPKRKRSTRMSLVRLANDRHLGRVPPARRRGVRRASRVRQRRLKLPHPQRNRSLRRNARSEQELLFRILYAPMSGVSVYTVP